MSRLQVQRNVLGFVGVMWGDQREYLVCGEGHQHPYDELDRVGAVSVRGRRFAEDKPEPPPCTACKGVGWYEAQDSPTGRCEVCGRRLGSDG